MNPIERRNFLKGTATGVFAFTVGGVEVLLSAREARAQNVPFRLLRPDEVETIEALGETIVPGARAAGIAHFIDQQLSVPLEEALLDVRRLLRRLRERRLLALHFANLFRREQRARGGEDQEHGGRIYCAA